METKVFVAGKRCMLPYDGDISCYLTNDGIWGRNNVVGKNLCILQIGVPEKKLYIQTAPKEELEKVLLDTWFQVEYLNDRFAFRNKQFGETRPHCLADKIAMVNEVTNSWVRRLL